MKRSTLLLSLRAGAIVWAIFAIVQVSIAIPLAGFFHHHCCNGVVSWKDVLGLIALYAAAGGLSSGLTIAALMPFWPAARAGRVAEPVATAIAFVILLCLVAVRATGIGAERDLITTVLAAAVAVAMICLITMSRGRVLVALARPWPIALVLTGLSAYWGRPFSTQPTTMRVGFAACLVATVGYWAATKRRNRMPDKSVVLAAAVLALAVAWLGHAPFRVSSPPAAAASLDRLGTGRPDIILVVLDTVRADHMSVYGYERNTTPNLRRFADEATIYTRAFAASSHTLPSHASMFTGLYPSWHGAHYPLPPFNGNETDSPLAGRFHTLAEILAEDGYITHSIVANAPYLGDSYNLHQGFDSLSTVSAVSCGRPVLPFWSAMRDLVVRGRTPVDHRRTGMGSEVTAEAIDKLDRSPSDRPVLLFLNYLDAHDPRVPPPPFDRLYPGKSRRIPFNRYQLVKEKILGGELTLTAEDLEHVTSQYDGAIAFLDAELKRLFDHVQTIGRFDNSLIIVTSDHGERLGEGGLLDHNASVARPELHVPLIVKYPLVKSGGAVSSTVSGVDLLPTILDVLGKPVPKELHGVSLRKPDPERMVLAETFRNPRLAEFAGYAGVERALIGNHMKVVDGSSGRKIAYAVGADGSETPVEGHAAASAAPLDQMLARWVELAPDPRSTPVDLDPETLEEMRSLGYVR